MIRKFFDGDCACAMTGGNDSCARYSERRAGSVLDRLADIPVHTQGASLAIINAQRVAHRLFLGLRTVKKVHVVLDFVGCRFLSPSAQLVHPTSFDQNTLAELIPAESTFPATSFIILTVTMVVMFNAALGLRNP